MKIVSAVFYMVSWSTRALFWNHVVGIHRSVRMYNNLCQTIGSVETTMPLSDDDDDDHVQVTPRRRVPLTTASQDDSGLVVKGISV